MKLKLKLKLKFDKEKWKNISKYIVCALLIVGFSVLHFYAIQWGQSLHVKKISIEGNTQLHREEVLSLLQMKRDSLLMEFNTEQMQNSLLKHSWISSAEITRMFPSELQIVISERTPIAMLTGTETFYVDSDGVVLKELEGRKPFDVPIISSASGSQKISYGEIIPRQLNSSLRVANIVFNEHKDVYHLLSEIHTDENGDVVLYTFDGAIPILLGKNEMQEKLWNVAEFWKTKMRNISPYYLLSVDARFKERIVVKWKSNEAQSLSNGVKS